MKMTETYIPFLEGANELDSMKSITRQPISFGEDDAEFTALIEQLQRAREMKQTAEERLAQRSTTTTTTTSTEETETPVTTEEETPTQEYSPVTKSKENPILFIPQRPTTITTPPSSSYHTIMDGVDVGNMDWVLKELEKRGIKVRVTSGKQTRDNDKSHHNFGNAIDIVPVDGNWDNFKKSIYGDKELLNIFLNKNIGILDETSEEMLRKTGGTGAHFHIGPDNIAMDNLRKMIAQYKGA